MRAKTVRDKVSPKLTIIVNTQPSIYFPIISESSGATFGHVFERVCFRSALCLFAFIAGSLFALAQSPQISAPVTDLQNQTPAATTIRDDESAPLIVEGVSAGDVIGVGRSVVVRGTVERGVVVFGGDVIIEGRVAGDVAAIGGSIIQRDNSYIGGDVFVLGGAYHHGKNAPQRDPKSITVMYAGSEAQLREAARNPAGLLAPRWSLAYVGERLLAVLFWFVVSLALTAVTPNMVGRACARLRAKSLRVGLLGLLGTVAVVFVINFGVEFLPTALGALIVFCALLLLLAAYFFGRTVIHATTGRWLQQRLLKKGGGSESVALLLGALFWGALLSLPYVWVLVVAGLLVVSLGLTLTARHRPAWRSLTPDDHGI